MIIVLDENLISIFDILKFYNIPTSSYRTMSNYELLYLVRMYYSEGGHIRPEDRDYVEMWACLGVNGQCRIFIRNYIEHSFFHVITTGVEFSDVVCEIVGLNDCIADCSACDRVFDENTTYFIDSSKRLWRCSPDKIPN